MDSISAISEHQQAVLELLTGAYSASEEIERQEVAYIQAEKGIFTHRKRAETIEAATMAQVAREKDGDKLRFSNDLQRKSQLAIRLDADNSYRDEMRAVAETESEQRTRRVRIEKLTRDYTLSKLAYEGVAIGRRER
jgi:hypothetical protein